MQLPFKYTPPGGGGGGATIPTITADITINVPTDQATVAAALAWVRARVVLNGAIVTINVESALIPTINEQFIIDNENMPYLRFKNDGPVNVDSTGFVNSILGLPSFIQVVNGEMGAITGTWTKTAGGACVGFLNIASTTTTGQLTGATYSLSGFTISFYQIGGSHIAGASTFPDMILDNKAEFIGSACTFSGRFTVANNSQVSIAGSTISHAVSAGIMAASTGASISVATTAITWSPANVAGGVNAIDADTGASILIVGNMTVNAGAWGAGNLIRANEGGTVQVSNCAFSFTGVTPATNLLLANHGGHIIATDCSAALGASFALQVNSGSAILDTNIWTINHDAPVYTVTNGTATIDDSIVIGGGFNPLLLAADVSQVVISAGVVGGPSLGARFTVTGGSLVTGTPVVAANWGADNQAALVPTALGLILA